MCSARGELKMQNTKILTQEIINKQFEEARAISRRIKTFCDIVTLVSEGCQIEINGDTFYNYHNGKLMFEFIDFSQIEMVRIELDNILAYMHKEGDKLVLSEEITIYDNEGNQYPDMNYYDFSKECELA
jgi:hypothetical protein